MKSKQELIDKIRKILARADENRNDNEHEREIAMRQAQALLARHNLTLADCTGSEKNDALGERMREYYDRPERRKYVDSLFSAVCKLNNVSMLIDSHNSRNGRLILIGRESAIQTTRYMGEYLLQSIKAESRRAYRHEKDMAQEYDDIGRLPSPASYYNSFCHGATQGIRTQVVAILAEQDKGKLDTEQLSKSQALVLVNNRALESRQNSSMIKDLYPRTGRASGASYRNNGGAAAGRKYGQSVSLNTQVSGSNQARLN